MLFRLGPQLRAVKRAMVVTGAGISADSGVPTFRDSDGYWTVGSKNYRPKEIGTRQAFSQMPLEVWGWYLSRRELCQQVEPNLGHRLLAEWGQVWGDRLQVVSQNVDGLHLRAGQPPEQLYEVHGSLDFFRCWQECTTQRWPLAPEVLTVEALPTCPACQGLARPHLLWFDEPYQEELYGSATVRRLAQRVDLLVTVGTSAATTLPQAIVNLVSGRGSLHIDINPEQNPFSHNAQSHGGLWLQANATQGLGELLQVLQLSPRPCDASS